MMRGFIMILSLFSLVSLGCKKESNEKQKFALALVVNIGFLDDENKDLLDPSHPHHIQESDIEIYYLKGEEKIHVYDAKLDRPKNFEIARLADGKHYLQLGVSGIPNGNDISTTYIEIKDQPADTLTSQLKVSSTSKTVTRAWYNGDLKWDGRDLPTFTIIK